MVMVQVAVKNCGHYFIFNCNGIDIKEGQPYLDYEKTIEIYYEYWESWEGFAIEMSAIPDYYLYNKSISESEFIRLFNDALKQAKPNDVNHPSHYGGDNPLEVINVIEHYELGFHLGNVVKYVLRAGKKGNRKEDLEKALWYLQREITKDTN